MATVQSVTSGAPLTPRPLSNITSLGERQPAADPEHAEYYESVLQDAELLLKYAADTGIDINAELRLSVLRARTTPRELWDCQTGSDLLDALTKLTSQLRPVTAESLRACRDEDRTVNDYWKIAAVLALIIVPFSVASFVSSALSDTIRKDITTANELAVKLTAQLQVGAPGRADASAVQTSQRADMSVVDVVTELQQFAATIRSIDGRARELKAVLTVFAPEDPFGPIRNNPDKIRDAFELPSDILSNLQAAAISRIETYQKVRYFAQAGVDDVSLFYGAVATCVLPLLYALLGTCAYLLRSTEDQIRVRTYIPSSANSARFLIAGIGGAVVGLFNNFTITQGASIPPLALAFLVGYAVDVFFSFLEGLLTSFTRPKTAPASSGPTPASPKL